AWLSLAGFRDNRNSTRGWIFGTTAGFFYGGNIYGSTVAAKVYNQKMEDDLLAKVQFEIDLLK
ncbi:hypothetical protein KKG61_07640, partial [bacterium]|nr:hypothetical protein [bacterium]MBU1599956.1 hypothetical protein [bacterium]